MTCHCELYAVFDNQRALEVGGCAWRAGDSAFEFRPGQENVL